MIRRLLMSDAFAGFWAAVVIWIAIICAMVQP